MVIAIIVNRKKLEVRDTVNEIEQIKARIEKNRLTTKKRYDHQIKAHDTMDNMNGRKCDVEIQFYYGYVPLGAV